MKRSSELEPSCSGIHLRKKNYGESEDESESESEDIELKRQTKMKKVINGEIRGSSLYSRANDITEGNTLEDFCSAITKRFESYRLTWIQVHDVKTYRIEMKDFYTNLKYDIKWHWIVSDEHSTLMKITAINHILENEITPRHRTINFQELMKYIRRSRNVCFQLKWEKWEIEIICDVIINVFVQTAQDANNFDISDSSSSDEGYND